MTADLLFLPLALALGYVLRTPFHVLMAMRFESGLPAGDLSGVVGKIDAMSRRRWVDYAMPESIVPGRFGYPVLFHWLVSRFPRARWRQVSVLLNIAPDLLAATAVYVLARIGTPGIAGVAPGAAFLAALVVLTSPILLPVTSRLKATNGRAFGLLLVMVELVATAACIESGNWFFGLLAVCAVLLTALTSFFGLQVVVFFAPTLALLYGSWVPIVIVAGALAVGMAWPALGVREVVLFKIAHAAWYRRIKSSMPTTASRRALVGTLVGLLRAVCRRDANVARRIAVNDAPVVILVYSLPALALLPWLPAVGTDPVLRFCLYTTLAAMVVFVATSTRWLSEWGQSERYFEYVAPMVTLAATFAAAAHGFATDALLALLGLQLVVLAWLHLYGELPVTRLTRHYPAEAAEREVVEFLGAQQGEIRMSAIPQQMQRFWPRLFRGGESSRVHHLMGLIREPGTPLRAGFPYMEEVFAEHYQVPRMSPITLHQRFGVEYVVCLRRFLERVTRLDFVARLADEAEVVFENEKYRVYRVCAGTVDAVDAGAAAELRELMTGERDAARALEATRVEVAEYFAIDPAELEAFIDRTRYQRSEAGDADQAAATALFQHDGYIADNALNNVERLRGAERAELGLAAIEAVLAASPRRVLDYGAGAGALSVALAARGVQQLAVAEVSDELCRFIAWRLQRRGRAAPETWNLVRDEFAGTPVDVTLVFDVFPVIAEPEVLVRRLAGVLVPGGTVVTNFKPIPPASRAKWAYLVGREPAVIEAAFAAAGFREVARHAVGDDVLYSFRRGAP